MNISQFLFTWLLSPFKKEKSKSKNHFQIFNSKKKILWGPQPKLLEYKFPIHTVILAIVS